MNIQPFTATNAEYAARITLKKVLEPEEQLTIEMMRQDDQAFEAEQAEVVRILGEADGQIMASGHYWREDKPDTAAWQFEFQVHPNYQDSQAPAQMQSYMLDQIEAQNPDTIASETKEDETYRIRLLEEAGFPLIMRFPRSQLDAMTFDFQAYAELMTQLTQQGIEFTTLTAVMQNDPDWQRNVWHMFTQFEQDVPMPNPVDVTPFEVYAQYYKGDDFRPDSWAIALDRNLTGKHQYVGMCVVNLMPTRPDTLFAGITGVIHSHRRRKIATALKVQSVRYAQQSNHRYIYTDNEENNPMYDLNLQLGFQPLPAWMFYRKEM